MINVSAQAHVDIKQTISRLHKIISEYESNRFCYWAIVLKATNELIGEIDLYDFEEATENCHVSYSFGYNWWNNGFATEALKAVIEFGFQQMRVHKICAAHNTDNPASGKVMTKAGMQQEGIIRHMIRNAKHQYKDCIVYGMLQGDYKVEEEAYDGHPTYHTKDSY
ncbi:GNAT family N-acetyltransferase [Alkalicoccobacillus plakortidis]|uniref:GNAT family N-acetyltransferase n=1 Tax=Alkalicoccobacillus plakortidis TaxID=444060 RepID=A0ABT0XGI4_9BACI|nr:GNAT family N-acetyltransferase [Alkalicoccobacillus plakortidis]MCM2674458.1 GNAT family N-acetyltransferase [Alkalicoccobacillus plakortidis]